MNPLGIKGAGEAGVIPASAVIASAIEDAEGIAISAMPISPTELYELRKPTELAEGTGERVKVSGSAVLNADVGRVCEALTDPRTLAAAIPGCERLELVAPDVYDMVVTVGVGTIKGTCQGPRGTRRPGGAPAPSRCAPRAPAPPGTVSAECRMLLVDEADAPPRIEYDADAVVGGVVGGVGQRMLGGVARKLAGPVLHRHGRRPGATGHGQPGSQARTGAGEDRCLHPATGPVAAFPIAASPTQPGTSPAVVALAAEELAGAAAALSGVVLGYVMGRLSGRRGAR